MKLNWIDSIDYSRDEGEDKISNIKIFNGLIVGNVYHCYEKSETDVPWNGEIIGYQKRYAMIGHPTMDAAKEAVENKLKELINNENYYYR